MWWEPWRFAEEDKGSTRFGVGGVDMWRIRREMAIHLRVLALGLRVETEDYVRRSCASGIGPLEWTRGLDSALAHALARLTSGAFERERLLVLVREVQRYWLELRGLLNYVSCVQAVVEGRQTAHSRTSPRWWIGAVCTCITDFRLYEAAAVPSWYVRTFTGSDSLLGIRRLVRMRTVADMGDTVAHIRNPTCIYRSHPTDPNRIARMHDYSALRLTADAPFDIPVVGSSIQGFEHGRDPLRECPPLYGVSRIGAHPVRYRIWSSILDPLAVALAAADWSNIRLGNTAASPTHVPCVKNERQSPPVGFPTMTGYDRHCSDNVSIGTEGGCVLVSVTRLSVLTYSQATLWTPSPNARMRGIRRSCA